MSRNSKSKRDARKNKKKHPSFKAKSSFLDNLAPTPPVGQLMPNPFEGISDEERIDVITEIGTKSRKRVDELLESLTNILKTHDPIQLLSILSAYGLTIGIGDEGATESETQNGINQAHVEFLQASYHALAEQKSPTSLTLLPVIESAESSDIGKTLG